MEKCARWLLLLGASSLAIGCGASDPVSDKNPRGGSAANAGAGASAGATGSGGFAGVLGAGGSGTASGGSAGVGPGGTGASGNGGSLGASGTNGASGAGGSGPPPTAQPCKLNTGHDGDELCIAPPDRALGFQIHYGPNGYDEPTKRPFMLAPGEELTECFNVRAPNSGEVYLKGYHARMRPGSHHMVVRASTTLRPDGFGACASGTEARMLVGSSTSVRDFPEPNIVVPENDGMAMKLPPNAQLTFDMHYINTTNEPILREAWVNFVYIDAAQVKTLADPLFLIGPMDPIPPRTTRNTKGSCSVPAKLRIVELHGHYHAHTVRFSAWKVSAGQRSLIHESYDWHEPASLFYDSGHRNLAPDPVAKRAGGHNGVLEFAPGDRFEFECEVVNDSNASLPFVNEVHTGEMCIASGNYAPSFGRTWNCTR
jgi:hypothetical protein